MKYKVTITQTADGAQEYMQVISQDQFSTNIVLIGEFEINDARPKPKSTVSSRTAKLVKEIAEFWDNHCECPSKNFPREKYLEQIIKNFMEKR